MGSCETGETVGPVGENVLVGFDVAVGGKVPLPGVGRIDTPPDGENVPDVGVGPGVLALGGEGAKVPDVGVGPGVVTPVAVGAEVPDVGVGPGV